MLANMIFTKKGNSTILTTNNIFPFSGEDQISTQTNTCSPRCKTQLRIKEITMATFF